MQNTRYVVTEGARQKDEEWDPEENGGFAIHGRSSLHQPDIARLTFSSDPDKAGPSDPLQALEKQTNAQEHAKKVQLPRLEELQAAVDATSADPYTLSLKVRKQFRTEKKEDQARAARDTAIKDRYALPSDLALVQEDAAAVTEDKAAWRQAKAAAAAEASRRLNPLVSKSHGLGSTRVVSAAGGKFSSSNLSSLSKRILENTGRRRTGLPHR
jgi:coiled-coil domain-containing protein 130